MDEALAEERTFWEIIAASSWWPPEVDMIEMPTAPEQGS